MADYIRIARVLSLAKEKRYLEPKDQINYCFIDALNTANYFLFILQKAGENGLSTSQVIQRSGLSLNTCKVYLRELTRLGYLIREKENRKDAVWTFKK